MEDMEQASNQKQEYVLTESDSRPAVAPLMREFILVAHAKRYKDLGEKIGENEALWVIASDISSASALKKDFEQFCEDQRELEEFTEDFSVEPTTAISRAIYPLPSSQPRYEGQSPLEHYHSLMEYERNRVWNGRGHASGGGARHVS